MKTQNGFTLLETEKEFKEWLDNFVEISFKLP